MITYFKGAYSLNLLLKLHGSAVYRAVLLGLLSVGFFYLFCSIDQARSEPYVSDPTPIALLVGSVVFLIVFRVNYAYQRYWEACGAVFGMMSRWMDATVHTACYHLQSTQYDGIKPPSYFDHPDLDALFMTRERERHDPHRSEAEIEMRQIEKSINFVEVDNKRERRRRRHNHSSDRSSITDATPLFGPPMWDGGWGLLFPPTSTYVNPQHPIPAKEGFASTQGGRTPALFLQELSHLASLLNAVALTTLRNDIDGARSPLDVYDPGAAWPSVDSTEMLGQLPLRPNGLRVKYLTGRDRTPEARTAYNAEHPLPVLGGVSEHEIRFLQMARGPWAKTQLCWNWLSEFIVREHLAGSQGAVESPIISRTMQFLGNGMANYNQARKIMFIPFPFPHAQMSALYVWVMVVAVPLVLAVYVAELWLGALLTFFAVTCLTGLHEVARELENPFRNVPNDIPACSLQAQFNEALITMYSGYHPDAYWDPSGEWDDIGSSSEESPLPRREQSPDTAKWRSLFDGANQQHAKEMAAAKAEIERLTELLREAQGEQKTKS